MSNTATTFLSATRSSYGVVTLVTQDASANTYTTNVNLDDTGVAKPSAPTLATATTGGTVLAGTYLVQVSFTDANGETAASSQSSIVTTGSTSTITITSPVVTPTSGSAGVTGWYAYVSQAGGTTLTRQQAFGSATAIGTNLTITAPPTSTGAAPLTVASDTPMTDMLRALFSV